MFRALAVLRVVLLVNVVAVNGYRHDDFRHPVGALVLVLAIAAWTGVAIWAFASPARRTTSWLVADLAVALAAIALSPVVKHPGLHSTVPGFWIMGAMIAWAIHWRWAGGLVAAAALSVTDLASRRYLSESVYGNIFLLMIGGPIVGFMCDSLSRAATYRAAAERSAAAAAERTRLARAVHDGVLQVLALVQRRGAELGHSGVDLARLAGEQEMALRALIRQQDAVTDDAGGEVDLVGLLSALERRPGVSVAAPSSGVEVDAARAREIVGVVSACLDNVVAHVGADAPAWVLLEALPGAVDISVRDAGPGIASGRLEEAAADGRLGVASSIRGRVAELGGTAQLSSGSFGTEWEFSFPR